NPDAGYYEAQITTRQDLDDFLRKVDDLTYAKSDDGLTLGGRKIKSYTYPTIQVEDVAALWQANTNTVDHINAKWNAKWKKEDDDYNKQVNDYKTRTNNYNERCANKSLPVEEARTCDQDYKELDQEEQGL